MITDIFIKSNEGIRDHAKLKKLQSSYEKINENVDLVNGKISSETNYRKN